MNVILWARVSCREQREGYSIDAQLRAMHDKAERAGWNVINTFTATESARRGADRKVFDDMVKWLRKNAKGLRIKAVLSHKLDRVCRNMRDAVRMQEMEDRYGIKMLFVENEFSPTAAGTLSFNIMAAVAQYYSDNLRAEVLKGITEKARQGWAPGLAAFGYINDGQDKEEPIKPHPERAQTLQRIFGLYAQGGYTFQMLADQLQREGHTYRPSQTKFHRTALSYILNNRFYIGEITLRNEKYIGKHKLLIDRALFDRCQEILHGKKRRTSNASIPLAGGVFKCAYCSFSITGERIKRKLKDGGVREHLYYRCANNEKGPDHAPVRWKAEDFENAILAELKSMVIKNRRVKAAFRRTLQVATADAVRGQRAQYCRAQKRRSEIANMQDRLLDAYLRGIVNETTMRNMTAELDAEAKSLVRPRERAGDGHGLHGETGQAEEVYASSREASEGDDDPVERILAILDSAQNIQKTWQRLRWDQKRKMLDTVCSRRHVSNASVHIERTKPFDIATTQTSRPEDAVHCSMFTDNQ